MNESLTFGQAIEAIKEGYAVARRGWNGKGMYIAIQNGSEISAESARGGVAKFMAADIIANNLASNIRIMPHIDMQAADGSIIIGWTASQTDMLSNDWEIVRTSDRPINSHSAFRIAVAPAIRWIQKNGNPHQKIIISQDSAELISGEIDIPFQVQD